MPAVLSPPRRPEQGRPEQGRPQEPRPQQGRPQESRPQQSQPQRNQRSFLLQRAQPAMTGLIDGALSTLAPIFAVAFATHQPHYAFLAGLATAIGAGVSMAFSEGLSDTGDLTGRGRPLQRGAITGAGTFLGGVLHTLPFLIPEYRPAVVLAAAVAALELLALAWIRRRFFGAGFLGSLITVTLAGAIIATISATLGAIT
jgi:erythrin-vacuolar iron transport family protein